MDSLPSVENDRSGGILAKENRTPLPIAYF